MYPAFFSDLLLNFKAQDITQKRIVQLSNIHQDCDEDNTAYMERV